MPSVQGMPPEQIATGNRGERRDFPFAISICTGICMFHKDLDISY